MDYFGYLPTTTPMNVAPAPLYVPDYSDSRIACNWCGRMLSQVSHSVPMPCFWCHCTHYCDLDCYRSHLFPSHRPVCLSNIDASMDPTGAHVIDKMHALRDLKSYGTRWHDALGDAAISALNLALNPGVMDEKALVVHVSYIRGELYRVRRFRFSHATVENISSLAGPALNAAIFRRKENALANQQNGMMGCIMIVLACKLPVLGFIFSTTYVGPEESVLAYPPLVDWERRLACALSNNNA